MVESFHKGGIKVAANIKPCLLFSHPKYHELTEEGFITDKESKKPYLADFWGGKVFNLI